MKAAVAFALGAMFAVGLGLSGMSSSHKVRGFLDFAGHWDPSLAFVMGGAIGVYALLYVLVRRRGSPLLDNKLHLPQTHVIDAKLVVGSALFGVGWGLSGYCPGPALMALGTGRPGVLVFGAAMLLSSWATRLVLEPRATQPADVTLSESHLA